MIDEDEIADNLLPGRIKKSPSYHRDYGKKTYREIKALAKQKPRDPKAVDMKKLIEQTPRLMQKPRGS